VSTASPEVEIRLNGEPFQVAEGATIGELLTHLDVVQDRVAVELDREIVRRDEWAHCRLRAGSVVEIVHLVGGG